MMRDDSVSLKQRIYPYRKLGRYYFNKHRRPESYIFRTIPNLIRSFYSHIFVPKKRVECSSNSQDLVPHFKSGLSINWIGHATFLIQLNGVSILTDPIFGQPSFLFPRLTSPGVHVAQLPPIDLMLVSHNHWDHMHLPSLAQAQQKNPGCQILVPYGDKAFLERKGFVNVRECMWWDTIGYADKSDIPLEITFLPASHWSARGLFDKNKSLWGSFMLQSGSHTMYFAGDTAYDEHFGAIAQEFPNIKTALLPIGPMEPYEKIKHSHMNPQDALRAFTDLGALDFVAMHWGTFGFGTEQRQKPAETILRLWEGHQKKEKSRLYVPRSGELFILGKNS